MCACARFRTPQASRWRAFWNAGGSVVSTGSPRSPSRSRAAAASRPDAAPQPAPDTVSVVVCAHTKDRWDDIVAGQAGLAEQTFPALETILVIDHNPAAARPRARRRSRTSA